MEEKLKIFKVTQNDCYKVISAKLQKQDFEIIRYEQLPFEEKNGFLGEHSTLRITINRNSKQKTHNFFVKFPPINQSQRKFLDEINGIFKEQFFFLNFYPLLKKHKINIIDDVIPACYHVTENTLILEDLKVRGYMTLPSRIPLKINYVKAALSALAKLHATDLILEEIKSFRIIDEFPEEFKEGLYLGTSLTESVVKACEQGIRALIDITHQNNMRISKEEFKEKATEGCELQKTVVIPSKKFRNTICHGDPWTKNFLFKAENNDVNCIIVDFQTYRYSPPAQDVVAFLYLVTEKNLRSLCFNGLLEFYFQELRKNLKKFGVDEVITKSEFLESCEFYKRFAMTQALTHFQIVILADEIANELLGDEKEGKYVLLQDRYEFIKNVFKRDDVFKKRNLEVISDLREFYEKEMSN